MADSIPIRTLAHLSLSFLFPRLEARHVDPTDTEVDGSSVEGSKSGPQVSFLVFVLGVTPIYWPADFLNFGSSEIG